MVKFLHINQYMYDWDWEEKMLYFGFVNVKDVCIEYCFLMARQKIF